MVTPDPLTRDDLVLQGQNDTDGLFSDTDPLPEVLTLPQAIARALKYNLDHRVKMMKEALALDQMDMDRFDLLPDLVGKAGYRARSEFHASRDMSLTNGTGDSDSYSYSSEKGTSETDLTVSWNILDFGIGYYTAKQNTDLALIATERRRKVIHNLIREVRIAYWRVVAYQVLEGQIHDALELAEKELANADTLVREGLEPIDALRYQKILLENISKLENIRQELSTAHITLALLINAKPGTDIRVAVPEKRNLEPPKWDISLDDMEELAFLNNPDIREKIYESRIAVKETRKAILRTLPGIELAALHRYDSNDFLKNNRWYEWSTTLTWNVFNILSAPERIEYAETNEQVAEMQRLALRMAVLAQVHVANRQFLDALRQFQLADKSSQLDKKIAELTKKRLEGNQSIRDFVYEQTGAIASQLRRYQTYANLEAAYGKLHATLGLDITLKTIASSDDLQETTVAVDNMLSAWKNGNLARRALIDKEEVLTEKIYFMSATGTNAEVTKISLEFMRLLGGNDNSRPDWSRWKGYDISISLSD